MNILKEFNLALKKSKFNDRAIVIDASGEGLKYFLKYDEKLDNWLLLDTNLKVFDITYLDIKTDDFKMIEGFKTLFLRKIDNGKFNKITLDLSNCTFTGLSVNTKVWLANKIDENNKDIKKPWWENPAIIMGGYAIGVLIVAVWFISNYKEGGILIDTLSSIKTLLEQLIASLQKSGIIEQLQPKA